MSAGRPSRPAHSFRAQARRRLSALPIRIAIVLAIAAMPPLMSVAIGESRMDEVAAMIVIGCGIAMVGIDLVVTRPLRDLRDAVDAWRMGQSVMLPARSRMPAELRGLGLSFKRATRTLARREAQLRIAVQRQELAMQEIHHRVKNNLQIVASLLNLQASRIRLPEAKAEFQSARDRIRALATVHRHLYAHGELHTINMRSFLLELCGQLFQAMGETEGERLTLEIDAPELEMSSDQAVPLSLIVTEAVTNAIKYGYPAGRRGAIRVRLSHDGDAVLLDISDDGIGILAGRAETAAGTRDGIGIQLINGFARQLGGVLEVEHGAGTRYRVRMKLRPEPAGGGGPTE
jgi:two-component sensor histidine kinase